MARATRACICGSDLHPYHSMPATPGGESMGHEFIGIVEDVGTEVVTVRKGDFVIAPFAVSDGTCEFCRAGLQTSCLHGGFWNDPGLGTGGWPGRGGSRAARRRHPRLRSRCRRQCRRRPTGRPAGRPSVGIVRPGGVISRVGVPQYEDAPVGFGSLFGHNATLTGGPAPVRAYIDQLLPAVLDGAVQPGKVLDQTVALEDTPKGYAAMDERPALKVVGRP